MISQLQSLAAALLEMWDLMDTPLEEQQKFLHVTSKIAALESEFTESKILSIDSVIYVSVFFFHFFVFDNNLGSVLVPIYLH